MPLVQPGRWSEAFSRRNEELDRFVADYFAAKAATTLFVCGTGFDPRATVIADCLGPVIGASSLAWLLREERPTPHLNLVTAADRNTTHVQNLFPKATVVRFQVFADDGALAAGPNMVRELPLAQLDKITDVILDFSSLSIGVAFPIASWLDERASKEVIPNLHFMIAADAEIDRKITSRATSDQIHSPIGFRRPSQTTPSAATLWVPQLHRGQLSELERVAADVHADEVVPLLPFPTRTNRDAEELIVEFGDALNAWEVDPRNIVYAAEDDPLDTYRILVRLARERSQVFKRLGASEVVITPMGSKVVAMGALMAALEEKMSVRYVETLEYEEAPLPSFTEQNRYEKLSVWLHGGPKWKV